jgi:predicted nicotinamide N-methyase
MTVDYPDRPAMPETPLAALGPILREQVIIEDRPFSITRPTESDGVMLNEAVRSAFASERYIPYWADLWPAARMLAKWIIRQSWPPGLHALEVGCGLGLPGIAALAKGVRVTFSDYDATALRFASENARRNGFRDFDTLQMDWRFPPDKPLYRVILAADLIYELRNVEPLVRLVKQCLAPDGVCLLTDQDRIPAHALKEMLSTVELPYTTQMVRAGEPGGRRLKGTLYRIMQPGGQDPLLSTGQDSRSS